MSVSPDSRDYGRFDELAEEFAKRHRRGERPTLEEYVDRLPGMANEIREMFPALVEFERINEDARGEAIKHQSTAPRLRELGDYRLVREIGRGGMGVVYEAEQVSLGRRVALKVLPNQVVGDPKVLARFRREAKAAARLHHTNIVPVFEVGLEGDVAFYAMQFIQGQGLDQVIAELARRRSLDQGDPISNRDRPRPPGPVGPTQSFSIAAAASRPIQKLEAIAQSLLSGRLETEPPTSSGGAASAINEDARTDPADPDATAAAQPRNPPEPFPPVTPRAHLSSSAVLPGGTVVSSVESTNLRQSYFRSVAQIGRQVAQGLAYAHSRGVIHRDIKPSNLLLDTAGVVWITDFGLAKAEEDGLTATGDILGTFRYMAPERYRGEGDALADVYALGLTLYELLALRPAYEAPDRLKLIEQIKSEEPKPLRSIDRHIPRDLETIVLKAIEKEPASRYASAEAMAEDLHRFLADEPIRARQVSASERYWRWVKRNPFVASLLAAVAAALLLGMAGTSYYALQANKRALESLASAKSAREEKTRSDLRWYAAESTLAQKEWEEGELALLEQRLGGLKPHSPDAPDLRAFEWYYLQHLCRLAMRTLPGHSAPVYCVAFSPDGKLLASASGKYGQPGEVKVWDIATGRELHCLRGHNDLVSCVAFSPDSRRLASANGGVRTPGEIKIWDTTDGRELRSLPAHSVPVRGLSFSPDGRQLASLAGGVDSGGSMLPGEVKVWDAADGRQLLHIPGTDASVWSAAFNALAFSPALAEPRRVAFADGHLVRVCDAATGKEVFRLGKHSYPVNNVAFSPDGRRLASGSNDGTVKVWDADTGKETLMFHDANGVVGLAFSPDSQRIAAAAGNNIVKVWDLTSQNVALVLHGHKDAVASVAFSPDGWRLASGGGDGTVKLWDATMGAEAVTLSGFPGRVNDIAFDADGRRLAVASGLILRVVDTITGVEIFTLTTHSASIRGVAFSPDGRRLASTGEDRTVRLWDATNGSEIFCLRGHTAPIWAVAFSPNGQRLASIGRSSAAGGRPASGEVLVWDLKKGQAILSLLLPTEAGRGPVFAHVTFSPDGQRLAAGSGRTVRVWNAATGQEILTLHGFEGIVTRIAFSPDGSRLAAASVDGSVRVWDSLTGATCLVLRGHIGALHALAYSPDGRRLVTAAGGMNRGDERLDSQVKLWDTLTGQEILTLRGGFAVFPRVAFDHGGCRLAASRDHQVTIWEGTPLDAELADERQAASLVKFLVAASPPPSLEVVSARVRDFALSDEVRQRALTLVEPFWRDRVRKQAEQRVLSLFSEPLFRPEVLARLRADPALGEPVRREALALAERYVQFPIVLNGASRDVAGRPGAEPAAYRLAVERAETACRLMPFEGPYQTTLGMAYYRMGRYDEAIATLSRADELNQATQGGPVPADLAFLTMSRYQMHEMDRAQASLQTLRQTMQQPSWARNEEGQRFRNEVEALLAARASQRQPGL